jgi:hypothetical protein
MIGKLIGAALGKRIAAPHGNGAKGALIGMMVPMVARRAFGPLGLAVAGGYAAKKYYDSKKARQRATPSF